AKQRVALSSYAYLEGIAVEEYLGGGTAADARKLDEAKTKVEADGKALAQKAAADAQAKGQTYVPPPSKPTSDPATNMVSALATLSPPNQTAVAALAKQGVTPENWLAVNTLKYNAYRQIESDLADKAVADASNIADDAKQSAFITGAIVIVAL